MFSKLLYLTPCEKTSLLLQFLQACNKLSIIDCNVKIGMPQNILYFLVVLCKILIYNVNIKIKDVRLNVTQNGSSVDIKVTIYVDINVENIIGISSIQKIEDVPIDLKNISSINIYVVKPGDSIWKIAKKYKTSMENIIKTNKLENPNLIDVGQKILVIR